MSTPVEFLSSMDSSLYLQRLFLNSVSLHPLKAECPPGCKSGLRILAQVFFFLYIIIIIIIENAIVLYLFCLLFYSFYRETNKLSS